MLEIGLIREKPDWVKAQVEKLNTEAPIDQIVSLDKERRTLLQEVEVLRQERNRVSKEIGKMREPSERETKIAAMRAVGDQISAIDEKLRQVDSDLNEAMLWVPNMPHESVPVGPDEDHNMLVRQEGTLPEFDFEPLAHWDLGPDAGHHRF